MQFCVRQPHAGVKMSGKMEEAALKARIPGKGDDSVIFGVCCIACPCALTRLNRLMFLWRFIS